MYICIYIYMCVCVCMWVCLSVYVNVYKVGQEEMRLIFLQYAQDK